MHHPCMSFPVAVARRPKGTLWEVEGSQSGDEMLFLAQLHTDNKKLLLEDGRGFLRWNNRCEGKQGGKTTLRIGENNSKWNNQQRINLQKLLMQLNTRKTSNPIKRWEEDQTDISPRKTFRGLVNTWKDTHHGSLLEKCKSRLPWSITSHWSEWPSSDKSTNNKGWRGCGEMETSCPVGGNINWYSHYGEQYGDSLKNWE